MPLVTYSSSNVQVVLKKWTIVAQTHVRKLTLYQKKFKRKCAKEKRLAIKYLKKDDLKF